MTPRARAVLSWLNAWRQQPSTIGGLAALAAALGAWCDGDRGKAAWIGVGGLVALVMPDNTRLQGPMTRLLVDVVSACALHQVAAALPKLAADAVAVAAADTDPKPAAPPESAA